MLVFLFVGLQMLSVYSEPPFLCYMLADPADTPLRYLGEMIGQYIHFQNITRLHMTPLDRAYMAENMPVMIPVHPGNLNLLESLDALEILD